MKKENIKEKLIPLIEPYSLAIYSIREKREFGEKILEILLDGKVNSNELESIHMALYEQLTSNDLEDDYYLELSTVGAERPIESEEQLKENVGKYLYVESKVYTGNGTLLSYDEDMVLSINQKGRIKKITIKYADVTFMRTAIKF